jgi:hypothetical protein
MASRSQLAESQKSRRREAHDDKSFAQIITRSRGRSLGDDDDGGAANATVADAVARGGAAEVGLAAAHKKIEKLQLCVKELVRQLGV